MKPAALQWIGSLLLLATMIFAMAKFGTADQWIAMWVPFVIAGLALVTLGTIFRLSARTHR